MALKKFNAVSGFSVGDDIIIDVIDNQANVSANNLTVSAIANLGSISNVIITGGSAGYVIKTDGTGNLSWGIDSSAAGGSNTQVQFNNNSSVDGSANYTFDIATNTLNVTGTITRDSKNVTTYAAAATPPTNPKMGDIWYDTANDITYQYIFDGTTSVWVDVSSGYISASIENSYGLLVQRDANGNIYGSELNGASLAISGNANINANLTVLGHSILGNVSNISILGGSAGYVLQTDGSGNLSWSQVTAAAAGNDTEIQFNSAGAFASNSNFTYDSTTSTLNVSGSVTATNANIQNIIASATLAIGSQVLYEQGSNGFSVNEDFDASYDPTQTAYHFAAASGRDSVVLDLAIQGQYTTMIGTYGSDTTNEFVIGTTSTNTAFVFKNAITTQPVDLGGGNDLLTISNVGDVTAIGSLTAQDASLGNMVTVNYTNAVLTTGNQPNITSIGTLTSLEVSGNVGAGNIKTDHLLKADGTPYIFTTSAAGGNTQVQFNDQTSFAGNTNFTYNKVSSTLYVNKIVSNGAGLTNLTGSNVTGQVGNALVAGTVYGATQTAITSVGTLTSLTVNGITNLGGIGNIRIGGGLPDYVLTTDGTGTLRWAAGGGGGGSGGAGFVSISRDEFIGDGINDTFLLSTTPSSIQTLMVNIDGLVQLIESYTLTDASLSFSSPPLNGEKIEVVTYGIVSIAGASGEVQYNDGDSLGSSSAFTFNTATNSVTVGGNVQAGNIVSDGNVSAVGNLVVSGGTITLGSKVIAVASSNAGIFTSGIDNLNIALAGNVTLGSTIGNVTARGAFTANAITSNTTITGNEITASTIRMNDLYSNRAPITVTTNTVIDSFDRYKYRTAKYTIRVGSDDGFQSIETLLIHNDTVSYITVYGSISTTGTDIVTITSGVNGTTVELYATTTSSNTTVNLIGTYVAD